MGRRALASASNSRSDKAERFRITEFEFENPVVTVVLDCQSQDLRVISRTSKSAIRNSKIHCRSLNWLLFPEKSSGAMVSTLTSSLKRRLKFGFGYDERTPGGWRAFRPPGSALESEDEGIHLRRAQRHLHYRPAEDSADVSRRDRVCHKCDCGRPRKDCALCWHKETGPGRCSRGS